MNKTSDKLDEAAFFLKQMESNYFKNTDFMYFTSAFISSARSVLWIMRSEYHSVEGWKAWFESIKPTDDERVLFKQINAARVRTEKQAPLDGNIRVELSVPIPSEYDFKEVYHTLENYLNKVGDLSVEMSEKGSESTRFEASEERLKFSGKVEKVYIVLDELADEDVLGQCKKYYLILKKLVLECEKLFS
jgi:hypothetical protein